MVFVTFAVDETPSLLAIPMVVAVIAAKPVYGWLLDRSGRGELQVLFGLLGFKDILLIGFFLPIGLGGAPDAGAVAVAVVVVLLLPSQTLASCGSSAVFVFGC